METITDILKTSLGGYSLGHIRNVMICLRGRNRIFYERISDVL